eukprot:3406142-Rhodomonas_salina.2
MKSPTPSRSPSKSPTTSESPSKSSYPKQRLTPQSVLEIFACRPSRSDADQTFIPSSALSHSVADQFKIGQRTIRDIWNRRAWASITLPFWTPAELAAHPDTCHMLDGDKKVLPVKNRSQGRPRGAKGTVSRKKRAISASASDSQTSVATNRAFALAEGRTDFTKDTKELDVAHDHDEEVQTGMHEQQQVLSTGFAMVPPQQFKAPSQAPRELARSLLFDSLLPSSSSSALSLPFSSSQPQAGSPSSSAFAHLPPHLFPLLNALLASSSAQNSSPQRPFSSYSNPSSLFHPPADIHALASSAPLLHMPSASQSSAPSSSASAFHSSFPLPVGSLAPYPAVQPQADGSYLLPYWAKVLGQ